MLDITNRHNSPAQGILNQASVIFAKKKKVLFNILIIVGGAALKSALHFRLHQMVSCSFCSE